MNKYLKSLYQDYLSNTMEKEENIESVELYDNFQLLITKKNGNRFIYDSLIHGERFLSPDRPDASDMSEEEYTTEFGFILTSKIQNKGVTLEELSEKTGISVASLYRYMRGDAIPSFYKVMRLANVLDCDLNEFLRIPK